MAEDQHTQAPQDPVAVAPEPLAPEASGGKPSFLSTRGGKLVVAAAAVTVLLVVAGAVAIFLLLFSVRQAAVQVGKAVVAPSQVATSSSSQASTSSAAEEATAPSKPPTPVTFASVFVYRNPFKPLIAVPSVPSTSTSTSTTSSVETSTSTTSQPKDVLTLQDIVVVDGVRKAVLVFGGETFTAGAGEQLGTTPWKVLSVGTSSVTMLFGDEQVVLSVGEGIQK